MLREIQLDLAAALKGRPSAFATRIISDRIPAGARTEVYLNQYRGSLMAALSTSFPVTRLLVGDAYFAQAARAYVLREPPRNPRLYAYGDGFPAFLGDLPDLAGHPYMPDVAAFEWAMQAAYHAPDAAALDPGSLDDPQQMAAACLLPHPSLHLLRSRWPVTAIWQVHQPGGEPIESIDLRQGAQAVAVWRQDLVACWRVLTPAEAALLDALRQGVPLGDAARNAAAAGELDFTASFGWMLEAGLFREPSEPGV